MAQLIERWTKDRRVANLKFIAGGVTVLCPCNKQYTLSSASYWINPGKQKIIPTHW